MTAYIRIDYDDEIVTLCVARIESVSVAKNSATIRMVSGVSYVIGSELGRTLANLMLDV